MSSSKIKQAVGAVLLVIGTTVGVGMLALPVATGPAGFLPSLFLFAVFWVYMLYTAMLFLEVQSYCGPNTNLISMAHITLGRWGEVVCWLLYLFLLYSLMTAYIAGSGSIISDFIGNLTGVENLGISSSLPLLGFIAILLLNGVSNVDYLNRILMVFLAITYLMMLLPLFGYVKPELLLYSDPWFLLTASPVVATSFGFHIIIPSLYSYLEGDVKLMRNSLFIGSAIPLIIYLLWELVTLGTISVEGPAGLLAGWQQGATGVHLLMPIVGKGFLAQISNLFSLFAILTSVLGVSLSLFDFLADGLRLKRSLFNNLFLLTLTFLPPMLIALWDARAFLTGLEYAGVFGVICLLGLMPTLMVWRGRYYLGLKGGFCAPGGKLALFFSCLLSLSVIAIKLIEQFSPWL